ncbi:hypothetical protein [Nonomuraea jabiensis]|uniref:hypothetical protein n=1 Tax=Nonomuraea jabiensis TaxID=882448 RepID=UPI0036846CC9
MSGLPLVARGTAGTIVIVRGTVRTIVIVRGTPSSPNSPRLAAPAGLRARGVLSG